MIIFCGSKQTESSPGGLEPPTFRLTAERANRLRHGDFHGGNWYKYLTKFNCVDEI